MILATTAEILRKWNLTCHEHNKMIDMIDIRNWNNELSFANLLKIHLWLEHSLEFPFIQQSILHLLIDQKQEWKT